MIHFNFKYLLIGALSLCSFTSFSQAGFDTANASSILDGSDKGITGNDRGFSFNSTHVYVANTSKVVTYYEIGTTNSGTLDETGIGGGTLNLFDVVATESGILASNLALGNAGGTAKLKIYKWENHSSAPTVLLEFTAPDGSRLGEEFTFSGSANGDGTLHVLDRNSSNAYIWSVATGAIADQASPTIINFAGLTNPGATPNINAVFSAGVKYWLVDGFAIAPVLYSEDGQTALTNLTGGEISSNRIGKDIVEFNNKRYYITTKNGWSGAGFEVYDISGGDLVTGFNSISPTKKIYTSAFNANANSNGNGVTHIETAVDVVGGEVHVLSGGAANGFEFVKIPGNDKGLDFSSVSTHFDGSALTDLSIGNNGNRSNRGVSFNSTHAYVTSGNNSVLFWDHSAANTIAGQSLDNGTAVTQGFYGLNITDLHATDNGILGTNTANTGSGDSDQFNVYRWDDNSSEAEVILTFDTGTSRLGDSFNFIGDVQGDGKLHVMATGGNKLFTFNMSGGTINATPTEITFAGFTNAGNYPYVQPLTSNGVDYLLVDGTGIQPQLYSADGQTLLAETQIGNTGIKSQVIEFDNARYLMMTKTGSFNETGNIPAGVFIYDISGYDLANSISAASPSKLVYSGDYNSFKNADQGGALEIIHNSVNEEFFIMSGAMNNGFEVLKFSESTLSIEEIRGELDVRISVYPNPTSNRIFIQSNTEVKSSLYNISGKKLGVYNANEIDMSTFSNGIYIIDVKSVDLSNNKTFRIIKQ
jgi:hypothetical protein